MESGPFALIGTIGNHRAESIPDSLHGDPSLLLPPLAESPNTTLRVFPETFGRWLR